MEIKVKHVENFQSPAVEVDMHYLCPDVIEFPRQWKHFHCKPISEQIKGARKEVIRQER